MLEGEGPVPADAGIIFGFAALLFDANAVVVKLVFSCATATPPFKILPNMDFRGIVASYYVLIYLLVTFYYICVDFFFFVCKGFRTASAEPEFCR